MSETNFEKVKRYLVELDIEISAENEAEALFVVNDESRGIKDLIIDCEEGLLVLEQVIFETGTDNPAMCKRLLQMNRELVHGAFVLDETGDRVIFRDTLQLANLDLNEIEASVNALGLALAANAGEFIDFAKSARGL